MANRTSQWGTPNPANPTRQLNRNIGIFGLILGGAAALFALTLFFGSWYTIDQTERGVLLRNGAYVETVQPGLHFKWPWVESVTKVDLQTHNKKYANMESYSADQQPAHLTVSVTYHVAADRVKDVYERFAGDLQRAVDREITPVVPKETKIVFGKYTANRAISDRGPLNNETAKAILDGLNFNPIFVIDSVQIEDITFSPDYIKSVEQRMQAEVEVQKLRQNLERERVQANIVTTQASAQADATRARARAEADAIEFRGNAEAKAIKARAEALAQNSNLIALTQAERWDGKLPTHMLPTGGVPMLNLSER